MINIPNGHIIVPESVDGINAVVSAPSIIIKKGRARAVTAGDLSTYKFYGGIQSPVSSDFDTAVRERVLWAGEQGLIGLVHDPKNRKFDDRKFRFDRYSFGRDGSITLRFGPSHFPEHEATNVRALYDPAFHGRLMMKGQMDFNDPMAYFANAVAVDVVVETSDDLIIIGKRSSSRSPLYPGYWHNIGGFTEPKYELFDLPDDGQKALAHFRQSMFQEMIQEASITESDVARMDLIGATYGISSVDLNYQAKVNATAEHIKMNGFYAAADKGQHKGFVAVDFGILVDVLAGKKTFDLTDPTGAVALQKPINNNMVPLGRGGLLIYVGLKDKDALKHILDQPQYRFPA